MVDEEDEVLLGKGDGPARAIDLTEAAIEIENDSRSRGKTGRRRRKRRSGSTQAKAKLKIGSSRQDWAKRTANSR